MQAKAKRLARFKVELGDKVQSSTDPAEKKVSNNHHEPSIVGRNKIVPDHSTELVEDVASGNSLSEYEGSGSGSSSVIIGLCTDMCPGMSSNIATRAIDDRFLLLFTLRSIIMFHLIWLV